MRKMCAVTPRYTKKDDEKSERREKRSKERGMMLFSDIYISDVMAQTPHFREKSGI
jgi:hypothetical protein